jgi:hypothetical protein
MCRHITKGYADHVFKFSDRYVEKLWGERSENPQVAQSQHFPWINQNYGTSISRLSDGRNSSRSRSLKLWRKPWLQNNSTLVDALFKPLVQAVSSTYHSTVLMGRKISDKRCRCIHIYNLEKPHFWTGSFQMDARRRSCLGASTMHREYSVAASSIVTRNKSCVRAE